MARDDENVGITYLKMHGSVDWHFDSAGNVTKSGASTIPDDPSIVPLIYPGYKGFPEAEPFKFLHSHLSYELDRAYAAIFIGFAFRDQYINLILENAMARRKDLHIHCFNPASLNQCPPDSKLPFFVSEFSDNFHHYQKEVLDVENPLSIPPGSALHQPFRF